MTATTTIADEIRAWARRELLNAAVVTRNTEVHNHLHQAVERLADEKWAQAPLPASPAETRVDSRKSTAAA